MQNYHILFEMYKIDCFMTIIKIAQILKLFLEVQEHFEFIKVQVAILVEVIANH